MLLLLIIKIIKSLNKKITISMKIKAAPVNSNVMMILNQNNQFASENSLYLTNNREILSLEEEGGSSLSQR